MIPWIELHNYTVAGVTFQTWGTLVALGYVVGVLVAARRAKVKGLLPNFVWDAAFWMFIAAFAGARLFHAVFYDPRHFILNPVDLVDPRYQGYAMWGGLVGAIAAFWVLARRWKIDFWKYADALAWGMPWGIMVGRLGCFLIHDHPGTPSNFLLAVGYPDVARHDLGLYLSIGGLITGLIFLWLDRKPRRVGYFVWAFLLSEGIQRAWFDFYRVSDVHYWGLTPTQWLALPLIGFVISRLAGRKS